MSFELRTMLKALQKEVIKSRTSAFQKASSPLLCAYSHPEKLLSEMQGNAQNSYERREVLTREMIAEYQKSGDSFWSSLLLVAYAPMLSRFRGRLRSSLFSSDDLDQLVLTSFLSATEGIDLEKRKDRMALRLKQSMRERAFRVLQKEQRRNKCHQRCMHVLEEMYEEKKPRPRMKTSNAKPDFSEAKWVDESELHRWLLDVSKEKVAPENLDLVFSTLLKQERIRAYAYRKNPKEAEEKPNRLYERYKRRRARTLKLLRKLVKDEHLSPSMVTFQTSKRALQRVQENRAKMKEEIQHENDVQHDETSSAFIRQDNASKNTNKDAMKSASENAFSWEEQC